jgi:hypothetical protein
MTVLVSLSTGGQRERGRLHDAVGDERAELRRDVEQQRIVFLHRFGAAWALCLRRRARWLAGRIGADSCYRVGPADAFATCA